MTRDPILRAFDRLAERDPAAPLVLTPERRATRGDVAALACAAQTRLAGAGLAPGRLAGLVAPNGPGFLASFVALARAGAAVLLLDGQTPEPEALRVARGLGAAGLLRCRSGWPAGPDDWSFTATPAGAAEERRSSGEEACHLPGIAVVKLTSGSTGAPRGIATPAEAVMADDEALTATMGIRPDDRLLVTVPLAHSYGLSSLVLPALVRGTALVMPEESSLFDPFFAAERGGATVYPTVPAYLDALLRLAEPPPRPSSLRLVLTAGAPLRAETSQRFREVFGLPVHVFYGASECGGICYDREGGAAERGTVGAPVAGVRVTLAPPSEDAEDAEDGGAPAEAGTVTVESAAVTQGYLPHPDPRLGGGRFVAGDLAVWRGGELALCGRSDDLINIKGKKVNPREVEGVLTRLGGIDEVAVLGVPRDGGELLRAVVACRPGTLSPADVVGWCRAHLAPHKVPRSVILVPALPRTPRGKLDRPALAALGGQE